MNGDIVFALAVKKEKAPGTCAENLIGILAAEAMAHAAANAVGGETRTVKHFNAKMP